VRTFIEPTVILVSTKIDDKVIERFNPEASSADCASSDNDQFRLPFLLEVRPPNEFSYDTAKSKLVSLRLGEESGTRVSFNIPGELAPMNHLDEEGTVGQQGQLLRLAGWIDLESRSTVFSRSVWKDTPLILNRSVAPEHLCLIFNVDALLHTFRVIAQLT
jgi:DNA mismatch repair protein MSH5